MPNPPESHDELPPDETFIADDYHHFARFLAYVRSSRITVAGEVQITLAVPYEYKYHAMPMTDLRGVVFLVDVAKPMKPGERGEVEEDAGDSGLGTVPTLSIVRTDPFDGSND